ncbi:hypothetical protein SDC9_100744 [bioreactor metagenome]|uniref:Uncharacterized protein n=1 Tax=bioreactor metagenome TaxID=1076179 RepID=A0A645AL61_9ZZZZ
MITADCQFDDFQKYNGLFALKIGSILEGELFEQGIIKLKILNASGNFENAEFDVLSMDDRKNIGVFFKVCKVTFNYKKKVSVSLNLYPISKFSHLTPQYNIEPWVIQNYNSGYCSSLEIVKRAMNLLVNRIKDSLSFPYEMPLSDKLLNNQNSLYLTGLFMHLIWNLNGIILIEPITMLSLIGYDNLKVARNNDIEPTPIDILVKTLGCFVELKRPNIEWIQSLGYPHLNINLGKWIFLCPENIEEFSRLWIDSPYFKEKIRECVLDILNDNNRLFMYKQTLYHELGHAVFQGLSSPNLYGDHNDESWANLFASLFLDGNERILQKFALFSQPELYQKSIG